MKRRTTQRTERKREDALAGNRGRADKEARLALPNHKDGLGLRRGRPQLHQNDGQCRNSDRRRRVHDDAQRAMVCIAFVGVQVGNLGHDKQCQQHNANHRNGREEAARCAAFRAELCLETGQEGHLYTLYSTKALPFGRITGVRGCAGNTFFPPTAGQRQGGRFV
jgi:hypothetical protein